MEFAKTADISASKAIIKNGKFLINIGKAIHDHSLNGVGNSKDKMNQFVYRH
jgi:hypothetical protein